MWDDHVGGGQEVAPLSVQKAALAGAEVAARCGKEFFLYLREFFCPRVFLSYGRSFFCPMGGVLVCPMEEFFLSYGGVFLSHRGVCFVLSGSIFCPIREFFLSHRPQPRQTTDPNLMEIRPLSTLRDARPSLSPDSGVAAFGLTPVRAKKKA